MLTRLKVDGFKNLDGLDVRFGPFTCVAGPNGVGKSNLFDAIAFLSALADRPLVEAALAVRGTEARGDVQSIFRRVGDRTADRIRFTIEFVIPDEGEDGLGQPAKASMTFLRYELELRYRADTTVKAMGTLEVAKERMGSPQPLGSEGTPRIPAHEGVARLRSDGAPNQSLYLHRG
ncbi:MAG: hypothetical protein EXR72_00615 [Myxococcales bacterium]|nr:hypothetical protein [Myxococcales bacterium]